MKIEPRTFTLPNGEVLAVRSVSAADAETYCKFKNTTYRETHFLARDPEEGHYELEKVRNGLAACEESPVNFEVGVFDGEEQVGDVAVCCVKNALKTRHRAVMGISVRKDYWGCGLGSYLMQLAIDQTRANGFEQLDDAAARFIAEKYPNALVREFDWDDGLLEVEIYHEGKEKSVCFDGAGRWVKTEWDVRLSELPDAVRTAIAGSQYASYRVDDIEYVQTSGTEYYRIELERGDSEATLRVDASGNML